MSDLSFTFSSDAHSLVPRTRRIRAVAVGVAHAWRNAPRAVVLAGALTIVLHLVAVRLLPHPLPRPLLAQKAERLLTHGDVRLLVLGDSRGTYDLAPVIIADALGVPSAAAANLAGDHCDVPAALALYRDVQPRLSAPPTILLSISFWSVNDANPDPLGDELLASLNFAERQNLVGLRRAVLTPFLTERSLVERWTLPLRKPLPPEVLGEAGFVPLDPSFNGATSAARIEKELARLMRTWFNAPCVDGVRWSRTAADVRTLRTTGAPLAIVDAPLHPALLDRLEAEGLMSALDAFRARIDALGEELGLPVLRYDAADLDAHDPAPLFFDLLHLNADGARRFSRIVGDDLRRLRDAGLLAAPPAPPDHSAANNFAGR
ncbi:MAG: hypothetical protein FLDDKLPJ_01050 [Phycisphaerae bacterium]|nr:hypothetical protein [Phycisphaerae bacterium]